MLKKVLVIIAMSIGLMAMVSTDVKAGYNDLGGSGDFNVKYSYWNTYTGCLEIAGGGPDGLLASGLFVPIDAYVSALNNGGNEALIGGGHFTGVTTDPQDAYYYTDQNGRFFVCFDLASNADECVLLEEGASDPPVFPDDYRFPGCAQYYLPAGECDGTTYSGCGASVGDRYGAFALYWGIDTSDLKNNDKPYRVLMTSLHAWIGLNEVIDTTLDPDYACLTDVPAIDFVQIGQVTYRCVKYGLPVGFPDEFSVRKNTQIFSVPAPGLLFNDVDTAGDDPLTVDLDKVNKAGVPGVLTVNADGSFEWDLTGVDNPAGIYQWTYMPYDGTNPNKTLDTTVTLEKK